MLDWNQLRFLLAISRSRSLSGAARELAVEHSTVGRQLEKLEKTLQTRLFDRTPEGYVLTPGGEIVLEHAREMEEQALALERKISGQDIRVSGTVRISALDACINEFILPSLPALHERFPELNLVLSSEIEVADLGRRKADIAIRYLRPREPNLVVRRLADVTSALYASKEYTHKHGGLKKLNALQGHRFIGLAPEYSFASEEQWIQSQAFEVNVVVRVTSQLALREAIREGIGVGIIECYLGDRDPNLERIWQRPILKDNWWLVVHKDMRHAARIRAVMDFLIEQTTAQSDLLLGQVETGK